MCTAFVGGVPTLPVYLGELQARSLGAAIESWDPEGRPLIERGRRAGDHRADAVDADLPVGRRGRDERCARATSTIYPGVWRHGDWIKITSRGTAVIYGRSDSTINRGGVRMGTSEIYSAVLAVDEVVDALVIDVPREGTDGWMPLFVVLREGAIARRLADRRDPPPGARGLLAAARARRDPPDRRGAADAVRQGPRGARQADPDGHARRAGRQPRVAREPRRRSITS